MFKIHRYLWAALGLAASLAGLTLVPRSDKPPPASAQPAAAPVLPADIDPGAVQAHAWARTQTHLAQAERRAGAALDAHLASIHAFLNDRSNAGSKAFAEGLVSLIHVPRGSVSFGRALASAIDQR